MSLSICHIIQGHFQQVPIYLRFNFQFFEYFALYPLTAVYTKKDTRNFCLFVYLRNFNHKSLFLFLETVQSSRNTSYQRTSHICGKCQYHFQFYALIFIYILEKFCGKKCNVLEIELKTYTPVGPEFAFEKIKFKVLCYIQHDFLRQNQGSVKIKLACSKFFLLIDQLMVI